MTVLDPQATSAGEVNRLPGIITDIVYLGSAVKYNITTEVGEAVVRVPESEAVSANIEDRVEVAWKTEDSVLLADDGS